MLLAIALLYGAVGSVRRALDERRGAEAGPGTASPRRRDLPRDPGRHTPDGQQPAGGPPAPRPI
jgi:hypothetical protein